MCNGTNTVKIKTIHGQFDFRMQKYLVKGKSCNYLDLTNQLTTGNISNGLQEFVAYYSNRLSDEEVEDLVERISGDKLLSDQKIWEIVVNKAVEVSRNWQQEIQEIKPEIKSEIPIAPRVDIYDPLTEEILKCKLKSYSQKDNFPLPIVAITDGASNIRKRLHLLNCQGITLILDWYHLCKKLREFLSMIARNKAEKTEHSKFLFLNLWHGNTSDVVTYLRTQIKTRNQQKLSELITYITKHESEIINYELRRQTGKTIGSGRMEKGVDTGIGHRQKHKGMSWSALGSKALAILKVTECNGLWRPTWFSQIAA